MRGAIVVNPPWKVNDPEKDVIIYDNEDWENVQVKPLEDK